MSKFKVGDKVIVVNKESLRYSEKGFVCEIDEEEPYFNIIVKLGKDEVPYNQTELVLVEEDPEKPFNGKTPKFIHLPNNPGIHFGGGITIAYYEDDPVVVFGVISCAYNIRYSKAEGRKRSLEVLQSNPQKISIEALTQRYYQIRMFEPTSIEQLMRFLFNAE